MVKEEICQLLLLGRPNIQSENRPSNPLQADIPTFDPLALSRLRSDSARGLALAFPGLLPPHRSTRRPNGATSILDFGVWSLDWKSGVF